ncbi:MAG: hypothetical protein AAFY17_08005, partial [Cyanobacteria bacterium J06642_11]
HPDLKIHHQRSSLYQQDSDNLNQKSLSLDSLSVQKRVYMFITMDIYTPSPWISTCPHHTYLQPFIHVFTC